MTACHGKNWVHSIPRDNSVFSCSTDQLWCHFGEKAPAPFSASGETSSI